MEIELRLSDIEELESRLEDIVQWMVNNISSFGAVAFATTILSDGIDDAKKQLQAAEDVEEE